MVLFKIISFSSDISLFKGHDEVVACQTITLSKLLSLAHQAASFNILRTDTSCRDPQMVLHLTVHLCISSPNERIIRAATINDAELKCLLTTG